jgi:hypothetical protein
VCGCAAVCVAVAVEVCSAFPGETGSCDNRAECESGGMVCVLVEVVGRCGGGKGKEVVVKGN